jgi:hypothetical protein
MSEFDLESYLQQLKDSETISDCIKVPVPSIQMDQNYIFVSYSHKDYKAVYFDLAHLYCRGVRFWYDKGLSAGEDWEREVQAHIQDPRCCGVIFYLSTNMFLSESVFKEIEFTKTKKKSHLIPQKNYFCVNLQDSNISDMLFSVQEYQRSHGISRLDTKKLNILTATFSDDDTYIPYNSPHHVDELVEQIQRKFDVTNNTSRTSENELALDSITNPRIALFAFTARETDPIPLFKFLYYDFKKSKNLRPWYLFICGIVAGILASVAMLYRLYMTPDLPMLTELMAHPESRFVFPMLSAISLLTFVPYCTAKTFWLFYISPIRHKGEHGLISKLMLGAVFFSSTALLSAFAIPISLVAAYATFLLMDYIKPRLEGLIA